MSSSTTHRIVVGIDEVGRGSWAGPLVACAALLSCHVTGLKDSKLLSKRQRLAVYDNLLQSGAKFGLGWVSSEEVDTLGLSLSVGLAMQKALDDLCVHADEVIIDGNINYLKNLHTARCEIKADQNYNVVSAASICAKLARDAYMCEQASMFPEYGFDRHVGYGTIKHIEALKKHGLVHLHRRSFKPIRIYV